MAKKDPVSSYARNAGMQAAASGVKPYQMPGAYVTLPSGKSPGEQVGGDAKTHQVPGAYVTGAKNGKSPGEQVGGLSAKDSQPETGEKGKTAPSGTYPMDKSAALEAGIAMGMELAEVELSLEEV